VLRRLPELSYEMIAELCTSSLKISNGSARCFALLYNFSLRSSLNPMTQLKNNSLNTNHVCWPRFSSLDLGIRLYRQFSTTNPIFQVPGGIF